MPRAVVGISASPAPLMFESCDDLWRESLGRAHSIPPAAEPDRLDGSSQESSRNGGALTAPGSGPYTQDFVEVAGSPPARKTVSSGNSSPSFFCVHDVSMGAPLVWRIAGPCVKVSWWTGVFPSQLLGPSQAQAACNLGAASNDRAALVSRGWLFAATLGPKRQGQVAGMSDERRKVSHTSNELVSALARSVNAEAPRSCSLLSSALGPCFLFGRPEAPPLYSQSKRQNGVLSTGSRGKRML